MLLRCPFTSHSEKMGRPVASALCFTAVGGWIGREAEATSVKPFLSKKGRAGGSAFPVCGVDERELYEKKQGTLNFAYRLLLDLELLLLLGAAETVNHCILRFCKETASATSFTRWLH